MNPIMLSMGLPTVVIAKGLVTQTQTQAGDPLGI